MGYVKTPGGDCGWKTVEGFSSDQDYADLSSLIREQVRLGMAREERVKNAYSGVDWDERWYRCFATKKTWRLIAPDPPFRGLFKPV